LWAASRNCSANERNHLSRRRSPVTARALGESIFTEADTLEELRQQIRDAVACHFEGRMAA
jgi:hypothetical protein